MSRETIAKALKRLRIQSGLTADQVGKIVGKSGKTVNAWENNRGQPDAEMLMLLCDIYNVSDILAEFRDDSKEAFAVSEREKAVITAYRSNPEMQSAVNRLLGISEDKKISVYKAARSEDEEEDGYVELTQEQLDRLINAPETDDDF